MYDVIIVGGGPAGLQAALTLGRLHRSALMVDSGRYRNDPAAELHNFLTHDGTPPAEFRAAARKDLAAYDTVAILDAEVTAVASGGSGFVVSLADGTSYDATSVILATGVRDTLPDIPGIAELWGSVVAHCPFCHGHELSGGTVAIQGGPHAPRLAAMFSRIAERVVVLPHDHTLTPEERGQIDRVGADLQDGLITRVSADGSGALVEVGGHQLYVDGLFVAGSLSQSAPFAEQLGLSLLASGGIEIDAFGHTSLPGVYAAGDLAHQAVYPMPLASVLNAAAAGALAGMSAIQGLLAEELAPPVG